MNNVEILMNSINRSPDSDSIFNFEYYTEEGQKELMSLAETIEKMGGLLTVAELKSIKNIIDCYDRGDLLIYTLLEKKIAMIEHPDQDHTKDKEYKCMGKNLRPLQKGITCDT
jgi:hypothetical protein